MAARAVSGPARPGAEQHIVAELVANLPDDFQGVGTLK